MTTTQTQRSGSNRNQNVQNAGFNEKPCSPATSAAINCFINAQLLHTQAQRYEEELNFWVGQIPQTEMEVYNTITSKVEQRFESEVGPIGSTGSSGGSRTGNVR